MVNEKYDEVQFNYIAKQHNIMALIGNGFDMALLNSIKDRKMSGKVTSYSDFYDYITFFECCSDDNIIFQKMKEKRDLKDKDWADFELIIDNLLKNKTVSVEVLEKAIDELQGCFTRFLNDLIDPDVLIKVNELSMRDDLAINSLGKFLGDVKSTEFDFGFRGKTRHYDLFNFTFINFNYTMLLDNYLYLDKEQFDPHVYKNVDTNFSFYPDPCNVSFTSNSNTVWSSYVLTNCIHPHGYQSIPRSLLIGTDLEKIDFRRKEKRFVKSYWAQDDRKYGSLFEDTELFIIYGMSISKTDSWWFDKIYDCLKMKKSELIIYSYGEDSESKVVNHFFDSCIRHANEEKQIKKQVANRIQVVSFMENNTFFLTIPNS